MIKSNKKKEFDPRIKRLKWKELSSTSTSSKRAKAITLIGTYYVEGKNNAYNWAISWMPSIEDFLTNLVPSSSMEDGKLKAELHYQKLIKKTLNK